MAMFSLNDAYGGPQPPAAPAQPKSFSLDEAYTKSPSFLDKISAGAKPYVSAASQFVKRMAPVVTSNLKQMGAGVEHNAWQMAGELASLGDMVLGTVAMGPAEAQGWFQSFAQLLRGDKPSEAYKGGVDAEQEVMDKVGSPLTKLLNTIHSTAPAATGKAMETLEAAIDKTGRTIEHNTGGVIPAGSVHLMANSMMAALGMESVHETGVKLAEKQLEPLKGMSVTKPPEEPPEVPLQPKPRIKLKLSEADAGGPTQMVAQLQQTADAEATKPGPATLPSEPTPAEGPLPSRGDKPAVKAWAKAQNLSLSDAYKKLGALKRAHTLKETEIATGGMALGATTAAALDPDFRKHLLATLPEHLIELGLTKGKLEAAIGREDFEHIMASSVTHGQSAADYVLNPQQRKDIGMIAGLGLGALGAIKLKGGMWHPEAVGRLSRPLKLSLVRGLGDNLPPPDDITELEPKIPQYAWANRAIRNYLNRYAGTAEDPLKAIEIPGGDHTIRWEDATDTLITGKQASGPRGTETRWGVEPPAESGITRGLHNVASNAIRSYLSHVGDYLREHVPPAKLQQYDLTRAVKETADWDKKLAAKMNSVEGRLEGTTPYKKYPDGFQWVEVGAVDENAPLPKGFEVKQLTDKSGTGWHIFRNGKQLKTLSSPGAGGASGDMPIEWPAEFESKEAAEYAAKRLVGDEALEREGDIMGHCVGGYCNMVDNGEARIFSLRDPKGMSHVTVEVEPEGAKSYPGDAVSEKTLEPRIVQIKGKQNRAPNPEYLPYVQDFVWSGKWGEVEDLQNAGMIAHNPPGEPKQYLTREEAAAKGLDVPLYAQRGAVDPKLLARMAAIGLGTYAGSQADPNHQILGALLGGLGASVATAISPRAVVGTFKRLAEKDTRVRIDHLANANEATIRQAARTVWQLQNKIMDLVPDAAERAQISHYLEGDRTIKLTPKQLEAARIAREYFEGMRKTGIESGVLKGAIQNYLTHLWGATKEGPIMRPQGAGAPSVSPFTPFGRERVFKGTLAEGKKLGMVPKTEDVAQIIGIYGNSVARAIANKRMVESIKAAHAPDGAPLVLSAENAPPNYVAINHPQFSGLRVHPDIAPSLRFTFDARTPGAMMKGLETLNVATKRFVVSFSLFHAKALLDAAIGAYSSPLRALKVASLSALGKDSLLKQLRTGDAGDLVDKAQRDGLMFSMERATPAVEDVGGPFYSGMQSLQGIVDRVVPGGGLAVKGFTELNHKVDTFLWARLHAGMKLNLYSEKLDQLIRNNAEAHARDPNVPLRSDAELGSIAASFSNDIFGGLNWRRVAEENTHRWSRDLALSTFSPMGRRATQLLMFAPDWTLSTVRAMTKAFGEGSGIKGLFKPQTLADLHRQYLIRSAIYYVTVADGINFALSGHHIWQNKDPTTIDMGDGRTMQWSKHTMEPLHWLTKPGQQALNKLGVIPSEALEQALGTQYLSSSGHSPRMKSHLAHLARRFEPITGESFESGGAPAGIASFLGVPIYGKTHEQQWRARERKRLKREVSIPK
ncbi:MAG: PcfJ domain-containing protein [Acidiferrobacteraceae bacterium]